MRAVFVSVIVCTFLATSALAQTAPAWRGYGGNAQHTAPAPAKAAVTPERAITGVRNALASPV